MPALETFVGGDFPQADGKRHVHLYYRDHNGRTIRGPRMHDVPADRDFSLEFDDLTAAKSASLITDEIEKVEREVEDGADPATITREEITARQAVKPLVKAFMRMKASLKTVRVAEFIRDRVTDAILNADLSPAIKTRIRARVVKVLAYKADLEADDALREEL